MGVGKKPQLNYIKMPQLDFITFLLQVAVMFILSWSIQSFIMKRILPSNLHYNINRKYLWEQMSSFIIKYKFTGVLFFLHILRVFTKVVKISTLILNISNIFTGSFSKTLLKDILKSFRKIHLKKNTFIKVFFFKCIFSSKVNLLSNFGHKNKLNFLILENSTYSYVQNYLVNLLLKKKKRKMIMIKELRYCYLFNQILALKNLVNIVKTSIKVNILFSSLTNKLKC